MKRSLIDSLFDEHAMHRRMLSVLERIAERVGGGALFPAADMAEVLTYFREFVETVHHAKEDECIYPLLMSHADDETVERIGELIADHEGTKELLHSLLMFWEPADLLDAERACFVELCTCYASRLRRHMAIEEAALERCGEWLPGDELDSVAQRFAEIGANRRGLPEWSSTLACLEENYA